MRKKYVSPEMKMISVAGDVILSSPIDDDYVENWPWEGAWK